MPGLATPAAAPAVAPAAAARRALPAWAAALVRSGEAVACLSLAGNYAVKLEAEGVGSVVSYSVRAMRGGHLVPVKGPFEFEVRDVFGGSKGKAAGFKWPSV